jgi:hypothetical protein
LHGDAELVYVLRKLRRRLIAPHLGKDLVLVYIRADFEVHRQFQRAVVAVDRLHVIHVVHAAHLLLDGRGDGLLDGQRIGAGVSCFHQDLGRHDVGKLRDRQTEVGDDADDRHHNRNDDRDDGTINEKFGHGGLLSETETWNRFSFRFELNRFRLVSLPAASTVSRQLANPL